MGAAIEFRVLSFAIPQGRLLLDKVSLSVEEGTTTAILGRSGSVKTTLLRTVNRMVLPTGGEILIHGKSVSDFDLISLRRNMGYVIQETGLFPHFTVEPNAGLVLEPEFRSRQDCVHRSRELLEVVGLNPAIHLLYGLRSCLQRPHHRVQSCQHRRIRR
jgi:osmoprotectant transport system ATP-binding protein